MSSDRDILRTQLVRDEGFRGFPYKDSVGKWTIGIGRNLTDVGISKAEAFDLLDHDIDKAISQCHQAFPWFADLDPVRQRCMVNMTFNLGIAKLKTFTTTLRLIGEGRYKSAAAQMLQSLWAKQVGARATRLAKAMETGMEGL